MMTTSAAWGELVVPVTDPVVKQECSSCHMVFPPQFLPKRSWQKLVETLADHFGENASLGEAQRQAVLNYLLAHAADTPQAGREGRKFAQSIAAALGVKLEDVVKYGRDKGVNPRKLGDKEIGIHAIRAGDIVGDHTVLYGGPGERIELVHRVSSREAFAQGAVKAAKYVAKNPKLGKILSMQDVLGL